ncbi:PadR family transcriptional regulator [Streptomyces sp. A7024]|uniref:PadR family transcriptional regulator n=1 Tax=Streptomyces coryli TaxID=1128680 RepID=A0A6G4TZ28_9ACTN|nr:PadR family transcriptional regulator [Streptomyces coryli]NGN64287.1 PadR family transcriptional regulator [Streptomyces coryli]
MARFRRGNPLALAVLAFLSERPMHPYEIGQLLRQRGNAETIKINYGSLYTVVQSLEKHGLVEVAGVQRQGNRPERTVYALTDPGRAELHEWLTELVSVPAKEYPLFGAALSLMGVLGPDEVCELLTSRAAELEVRAAGVRGVAEGLGTKLPRLFLVETEYQAHMMAAEAAWVRGLVKEIESGSLDGVEEWRQMRATGEVPEKWKDLEEPGTDT